MHTNEKLGNRLASRSIGRCTSWPGIGMPVQAMARASDVVRVFQGREDFQRAANVQAALVAASCATAAPCWRREREGLTAR